MLSICIPTYNFDCRPLLNDLLQQAEKAAEKVEIIVMDDASKLSIQELYHQLDSRIHFWQLAQNVGRSKIRNLLANKATQKYLLFIDGDSSVIREDFISTYINQIKENPTTAVFCGGSVYADQAASKEELLRWKYSKAREKKSVSFLQKHPYHSFTTNNFVIEKTLFLRILFEERLTQYGHEDTLFGFELKRRNISLLHLSNPVLNGDLDNNEQFLEKSEEGLANLLKILELLDYNEQFIQMLPILRIYFRLKILGLEIFLSWWFKRNRKQLEKKFKAGEGSLRQFDFYRLGLLSLLFRNQK